MKKILLFGDSIRLGYERYVQDVFDGIAKVYKAKDTCAFSQYMLRWVSEWKRKESYPNDIDLVHWNVGLWDVLRIMDDGTFTTPEYYAYTLERLEKRLRVLFPKAKQVFALSTAVVEEAYEPPYQRFNADIERFNQIAIQTLTPLGVKINDLYTLTKDAPLCCRSDMTHFYTSDGIKLLGDRVTRTICEALSIPMTALKDVTAEVPFIAKEIIGN